VVRFAVVESHLERLVVVVPARIADWHGRSG
jgi:hypothetical protein